MTENKFIDSQGKFIYPGAEVVIAVKQGWDIVMRRGIVYRTWLYGRRRAPSVGVTVSFPYGSRSTSYFKMKNITVIS